MVAIIRERGEGRGIALFYDCDNRREKVVFYYARRGNDSRFVVLQDNSGVGRKSRGGGGFDSLLEIIKPTTLHVFDTAMLYVAHRYAWEYVRGHKFISEQGVSDNTRFHDMDPVEKEALVKMAPCFV